MTINWQSLPGAVKRQDLYRDLKEILTPERYANGEWTLTEIIKTPDLRAQRALEILDGLDIKGKRSPGVIQPRVDFRFKVLSRQACCRDKNGTKIWFKNASLENSDTDGDIVAKPDDLPKPGDVVEWKGNAKQYDEQGNEIDATVTRRWAYLGVRPEEYIDFVVDRDGCISVPYPWAYSMLVKYGRKISKPKFRRKSARQITNWFFEEVSTNYTTKKKTQLEPVQGDDNKELLT